jgi:hypothetical protein
LASSLVASMRVCIIGVYYGGLIYGYIISISVDLVSLGRYIIKFSRFDMNVVLIASIFLALCTRLCSGWFSGSVCILVRDCRILCSSRSPAGGSPVSYSRAAVGVVTAGAASLQPPNFKFPCQHPGLSPHSLVELF